MSWNGDTGLGMSLTEDCTIEDCTLMCNNYRHFSPGWHAGGMKNIPDNVRTTIRRCEVAYNFNCSGIWFDGASPGHVNRDIRIVDNVCHHNEGTAIFYEANGGGGVIAGNLCFANRNIGIDVQAHIPDSDATVQKRLWVIHNTVADNVEGIRVVDRGGWQILRSTMVMNNLILRNSEPGDVGQGAAADLLLWMHADANDKRADTSNHSDYNVFCAGTPVILKPAYGFNNTRTLDVWRQRFEEDLHSQILPILFECSHAGFRLLGENGLDVAGPLPAEVTSVWKPTNPKRVGANLTRWP